MPSYPRSAWERLGELLTRRRIELDPRYSNRTDFVSERLPGRYRIINAVERGRRDNYEPATLTTLEVAYGLAPGAIVRALEGGDLEPAVQGHAGGPAPASIPYLRDLPPGLEKYVEDVREDLANGAKRFTDQEWRIWRYSTVPDEVRIQTIALIREADERDMSSHRRAASGLAAFPGGG